MKKVVGFFGDTNRRFRCHIVHLSAPALSAVAQKFRRSPQLQTSFIDRRYIYPLDPRDSFSQHFLDWLQETGLVSELHYCVFIPSSHEKPCKLLDLKRHVKKAPYHPMLTTE